MGKPCRHQPESNRRASVATQANRQCKGARAHRGRHRRTQQKPGQRAQQPCALTAEGNRRFQPATNRLACCEQATTQALTQQEREQPLSTTAARRTRSTMPRRRTARHGPGNGSRPNSCRVCCQPLPHLAGAYFFETPLSFKYFSTVIRISSVASFARAFSRLPINARPKSISVTSWSNFTSEIAVTASF